MEREPKTDNPVKNIEKTLVEKIEDCLRSLFGMNKKTNNREEDVDNIPWMPWSAWHSWSSWGKNKGNKATPFKPREEIPVEDQDSYIPKDMEFWESEWEPSRFAVVYPFLRGKYSTWKLSYFESSTNLWSKKRKLQPLIHSLEDWKWRYTYAWCIVPWVNAMPLPTWALPDTESLVVKWKSFPTFSIDQNGCVYLSSTEKMWVSFKFWLKELENTKHPIPEDSEAMIFSSLSWETKSFLEKLRMEWISMKSVRGIENYIKTKKKYSTKLQWTLRNKSNRKNYVKNLDESEVLECYSANTLFVALCRYLWFSARLVTWFAVLSKSKKGEWLLSSNNWHAWSEVWDEKQWKWVEFDATPIKKEDWEDSNQNSGETGESGETWENKETWETGENQGGWWEESGGESGEQWWEESGKESWGESGEKSKHSNSESESNPSSSSSSESSDAGNDSSGERVQDPQKSTKSPSELLDEMIDLAKKEDLEKNKEALEDTRKKIEDANTKEEIRDILDNADLWEFSQEIADEEGNEKILEKEKQELENVDDESKLDKALQDSLLDDEYKEKLDEYIKELKKKIQEQKKRMQKEMERLWFTKEELRYYKEYKELEKEVEPEVKKQIKELKRILPANYQYKDDETQRYRSWYTLEWDKLVDYYVTWDTNIFIREEEVREHNEINMFETILIDTSWSMGSFWSNHSILRESVKAAIIRAKVLEHFKVDFSIVLFWDRIREVMSFWEKFSSKWKCLIPSKLMRAVYESWWNSQEPISYVYDTMMEMMKKKKWRSFGNISFIGDGDLYQWCEVPKLKAKIDDLKKREFWVTAYYINSSRTPLLWYYFWEKDWEDVIYARWCKELSKSIIESHRKHLRKKIDKHIKK